MDLQLTGEPVVISYLADPSVRRGHFRLANHGPSTASADVRAAWLRIDTGRTELAGISLYDRDAHQPFEPPIVVDPGGTRSFLIGFPLVAYEPSHGEEVAVGLELNWRGDALRAESPIRFERRIPLDPGRY